MNKINYLYKKLLINYWITIFIPLILSIIYIYVDPGLNYTNFLWIHHIFNSWIFFNIYFNNILPIFEQLGALLLILFIKYMIVYFYVKLFYKNNFTYIISILYWLYTSVFWYLFFNIMMSV